MYDCSSLVHHPSLIPPEKMLVSHAPSLNGQSLCSFLTKMDNIEYRVLKAEDTQCQPNPNSLTGIQNFGVHLGSWGVGGFVGFTSGMAQVLVSSVPVFNPYTVFATGTSAGLGCAILLKQAVIAQNQGEACTNVSISRITRLKDKESEIKFRAKEVVESWSFWKDKELKHLDKALIYLSNGTESLN